MQKRTTLWLGVGLLCVSAPTSIWAQDYPSVDAGASADIDRTRDAMKASPITSNVIDRNSAGSLAAALQAGRANIPLDNSISRYVPMHPDGTIAVDFVASGNANRLESDLRALGADEISRSGHMISARVSMAELDAAARLSSLQSARFASAFTNAGLVTSQGDKALNAPRTRRNYGVDGSGVMVGVLSDSYNCRIGALTTAADDQANDDLPAEVVVLKDIDIAPNPQCSDEGRAMMQHIHDVAPGASQAFHTAFAGQADFANGIIRLRAEAGAHVIVDDIGYFAEPFFQDGIIAQAVDLVVADGASYFSSAGNAARDSYEDAFRPGAFDPGLGILHDFDPGPALDVTQTFVVAPGDFVIYSYQWDEPHFQVTGNPAASSLHDVDILAVNVPFCTGIDPGTGLYTPDVCQLPGFSNNIIAAGGSGDPIEVWAIQNASPDPVAAEIVMAIFDGPIYSGDPGPGLHKYIYFQDFGSAVAEYDTQSGTSYGHSNAAGTSAVGASFWAFHKRTPLGREFECKPRCLNAFSSAGGIPILFDLDGNRLAEPEIRQTPDIVGPDGGNTTFFGGDITFFPGLVPGEPDGFPNFFGTSASAPHIAGVAALLNNLALQKEVTPPPEIIYEVLEKTAQDFRQFGRGYDLDSGHGFVNAKRAMDKASGLLYQYLNGKTHKR